MSEKKEGLLIPGVSLKEEILEIVNKELGLNESTKAEKNLICSP